MTILKTTELPFNGKGALQNSCAGQCPALRKPAHSPHALDRMLLLEGFLKLARLAELIHTTVELVVLAHHLRDVPGDP